MQSNAAERNLSASVLSAVGHFQHATWVSAYDLIVKFYWFAAQQSEIGEVLSLQTCRTRYPFHIFSLLILYTVANWFFSVTFDGKYIEYEFRVGSCFINYRFKSRAVELLIISPAERLCRLYKSPACIIYAYLNKFPRTHAVFWVSSRIGMSFLELLITFSPGRDTCKIRE